MKKALVRTVLGFLLFLPVAYAWGVEFAVFFTIVSQVYFFFFHYLFDLACERWWL